MKCPTTKLEVSPTVNPKFIDKLIINLCKWYMTKRGFKISIYIYKNIPSNKNNPTEILYINSNGNVGI